MSSYYLYIIFKYIFRYILFNSWGVKVLYAVYFLICLVFHWFTTLKWKPILFFIVEFINCLLDWELCLYFHYMQRSLELLAQIFLIWDWKLTKKLPYEKKQSSKHPCFSMCLNIFETNTPNNKDVIQTHL